MVNRHRKTAVLWMAAVLVAVFPRPLAAQLAVVDMLDISSSTEETNTPSGFAIKKEDEKVIEQLQDFERYRDKKAWDRAFKAIATVAETGAANGMSPDSNGFFIPTKEKLFRSLVSLPPAGREAYRLFNDAKAKQQWDLLVAKNGGESIADLRKLVDLYFITGIGPKAADRLGDAYFEAGDYISAARSWSRVVDASQQGQGDDSLSLLRIQFKRGVALARAHRKEQFGIVVQAIHDRFPGEKLSVGGHEVDAAAYLQSLTSVAAAMSPTTNESTANLATAPALQLPADGSPAWQMQFLDHDTLDRMIASLANSGWGWQGLGYTKIVPATATDGKRIYANWGGIVFAMDAGNGKLIWRTAKFGLLVEKFQELVQCGTDPSRYSLTMAGNSLFVVSLRLDRLNNSEPFRLSCLAADTGKKNWSSDGGELEKWAFIGKPLVLGDTLYITAHTKESQEINLLALNPTDGKLRWLLPLGLPQAGNNYRGMPNYPMPSMLHQSGMLYVLSNNGALIAVDLASRSIEWAFAYEIPHATNQNNGFNPYNNVPAGLSPQGKIVQYEGLLYIKETGMAAMFVIDPAGPTLQWRRAVERSDTLVGFDEHNLFLAGMHFSTIDRTSRTMIHSYTTDFQSDALNLVPSAGNYLALTARGIKAFDSAGGPPRQILDNSKIDGENSFGGTLSLVGDKLVSVSNISISAFPVANAEHSVKAEVRRSN